MACIGCGFELSAGSARCPQCDQRQPFPCISCGFLCDGDFSFCPRCGKSCASAIQPDGFRSDVDRRHVTVLFADLTGFTALSERLDAEVVRAFQDALFDKLAQSTKRYDGFVAKFMGDAVLSVFGAPVAHEDDPERALSAALDMLAAAAELSDQWSSRLGQQVTLHAAVHTGPVVAGSLGHMAAATYDVTGDTVNTASRLLGSAPAGSILVSDPTYALTRHRFAFEPAGQLTLRGKAEPITVHRVLGALDKPSSARGLAAYGLVAPMIGRSGELETILATFDRMRQGSAQVVNVVGDAGTGKSRLVAEALEEISATGRSQEIAVRKVACSSSGEPTYGIFGSLFREAYALQPGDSLEIARAKLTTGLKTLGAQAEVAEAIAPLLSYVLGVEETRRRDLEPEQIKRQISLAVQMLIERRLDQQPLLIIVEDLHWADSASVELLQEVVDRLAARPLMLLMTHRPDMRPPVFSRAAQSIVRLESLSFHDTRTLVGVLFGSSAAETVAELQDFIATRAGGNPLFVEEIVRNLISSGILVRRGEHWTCSIACEAIDVPPTVQGLLLSRVDRLPASAKLILQEASVVGMTFDETLLRAVAAHPATTTATLQSLIESDLIVPLENASDGNRYRFAHALMHEVVYQNLLLSRRTALHERAGAALERAAGSRPERLSDLEALGHHWSLAADKRKGLRYLLAAGDWARSVYANDDALRHYERALRTLAECQDCENEQRAIGERLADLLALKGRRAEALRHYEAVCRSFDAMAAHPNSARLYRKIGKLHWEAGDRERARACFASGLDRLGKTEHSIERAQLFQEVGRLAFRTGDNTGAIEWAERALVEVDGGETDAQDAERDREMAAMRVHAYNTLGVALARIGRLDEAVTRIERSIALAEAHDLLPETCRGYTNLGVLYSSLNPRRSIETCLRGLAMAKKVGDLGFQSRLYANLAVAYCALTDRCEAEGIEAAQTAIDLDRRLGLLDHLAVPLIVLGQIHQCAGEHTQAFASYHEALELAERVGEPQLLFPCYDGLAMLYLDVGDQQQAEIYLSKSQEVCERAGVEPDALMVLPFLN